jgi:hypothetical protein
MSSRKSTSARVRGRQIVRRGVREVRRAEQSFEGTLRENPLAVGAVALAVGAAIGLALPPRTAARLS